MQLTRGRSAAVAQIVPILVMFIMTTIACACTGCAVPGEPGPRRPPIPEAVRNLAARQQGDAALLTFTLPGNSVARKPLGELPTVDIYRGLSSATPTSAAPTPATPTPAAPTPATPPAGATGTPGASPQPPPTNLRAAASNVRLIHTIPGDTLGTYEHNGVVEFRDALDPAELARSPGEPLLYQVRTRVAANHPSAASNSAVLRVYPAPAPVTALAATVTEDAIVLSWTPTPAERTATSDAAPASGYRVYRGEIDPENAAAALAEPAKAKLIAALELLAEPSQPAYRDEHFEFGHTYLYMVRSIARWDTNIVESADSTPVVVSAKDVFPPSTPQNLEIALTPATPNTPASIELAWGISPEADLAGYEVYRSERQDEVGQRLNESLLPAPTFRDMNVTPGRQYFYRVRAVDRAGNESPLSTPVEARLP